MNEEKRNSKIRTKDILNRCLIIFLFRDKLKSLFFSFFFFSFSCNCTAWSHLNEKLKRDRACIVSRHTLFFSHDLPFSLSLHTRRLSLTHTRKNTRNYSLNLSIFSSLSLFSFLSLSSSTGHIFLCIIIADYGHQSKEGTAWIAKATTGHCTLARHYQA